MPELIEIEYYRQALEPLIGQVVSSVEIPDPNFTRPRGTPIDPFRQLVGEWLLSTERVGKLLCLRFGSPSDPEDSVILGLRFGMTGRLLVNGRGPIDKLEYASGRDEPRWDRFIMSVGEASVSIRDQRRFGSIELEPDLDRLGFEASTITSGELTSVLKGRRKAIKAVLLDQGLLAGLGNLLVDEVLWRAAIAPTRSADACTAADVILLATTIRCTVTELTRRGGSNTGDSFAARDDDARCPHDGNLMAHDTVGGRSTWWCPAHQR